MSTTQREARFDTPPLESELKPVPYFQPHLPEGLGRETIIFHARRCINAGIDLRFNKVCSPLPNMMINSVKKTLSEERIIELGYKSQREYISKIRKESTYSNNLLKFSALYQEKILLHEFDGKFPNESLRHNYNQQ